MSTKINARSPFYLSYAEPVAPSVSFDCSVARPVSINAQVDQFTIDQSGVVTLPSLAYGIINSYSSTDSGFSNGKYATVSGATARTITLKIEIPTGFSNIADVYIDCNVTATQPAFTSGTTCVANTTLNGTIPTQTIAVGGSTSTLTLSSYFTAGSSAITGYNVQNPNPTRVSTSLSGAALIISTNTECGTYYLNITPTDALTNSCPVTQPITVSINGCSAFSCSSNTFSGGSITTAGVITKPVATSGVVGAMSLTDGGAIITSVTANSGSASQQVTIYFTITAPAGFSNAGTTFNCPFALTQAGTSLSAFDCSLANLYGGAITLTGSLGQTPRASNGATVTGVEEFVGNSGNNITFPEVTSDTARQIKFKVLVPAGYSNTGATLTTCTADFIQPSPAVTCGSNTFYLTTQTFTDITVQTAQEKLCNGTWATNIQVTSYSAGIRTAAANGEIVCRSGAAFNGKNDWYGVSLDNLYSGIGSGTGFNQYWRINSNGTIVDIFEWNCSSQTGGTF
jgi:hypothetical protein